MHRFLAAIFRDLFRSRAARAGDSSISFLPLISWVVSRRRRSLAPWGLPLGEPHDNRGKSMWPVGFGGRVTPQSLEDIAKFGVHSLEVHKVNGVEMKAPVIITFTGNVKFKPALHYVATGLFRLENSGLAIQTQRTPRPRCRRQLPIVDSICGDQNITGEEENKTNKGTGGDSLKLVPQCRRWTTRNEDKSIQNSWCSRNGSPAVCVCRRNQRRAAGQRESHSDPFPGALSDSSFSRSGKEASGPNGGSENSSSFSRCSSAWPHCAPNHVPIQCRPQYCFSRHRHRHEQNQ